MMKIFRVSILLFFVVASNSYGQVIPSCNTLDWSTTSIYSLDCGFFEHGDWLLVYSDDFNSELDPDDLRWSNCTGQHFSKL